MQQEEHQVVQPAGLGACWWGVGEQGRAGSNPLTSLALVVTVQCSTTAKLREQSQLIRCSGWRRTRLVFAAALPHGLELWPVDKAVAVLIRLPNHVLHLCL